MTRPSDILANSQKAILYLSIAVVYPAIAFCYFRMRLHRPSISTNSSPGCVHIVEESCAYPGQDDCS